MREAGDIAGVPVAFSAVSAAQALAVACTRVGLDAAGADLVRVGDGAVFRLAGGMGVARVGRSVAQLAEAEREIRVARWLAATDVPAIRAMDVAQPVVADGLVVTFWESVADAPEYGTAGELAELLRRLHSLIPPDGVGLARLNPLGRTVRRIEREPALAEDDRVFLRGRCVDLQTAYEGLAFDLGAAVIHGDASVGNVIRDRRGVAVFADLDGFALGPREWDLTLTAVYYERFGWHTELEYREFVSGYGYDVMRWSGYPLLADMRELIMVTWLSQKAGDPYVAEELRRRISDLRSGDSRCGWRPF